jgi:hypothetical protein
MAPSEASKVLALLAGTARRHSPSGSHNAWVRDCV